MLRIEFYIDVSQEFTDYSRLFVCLKEENVLGIKVKQTIENMSQTLTQTILPTNTKRK